MMPTDFASSVFTHVSGPPLLWHLCSMFCAELGAMVWLLLATYLELPVSSTHSISECLGVGGGQRERQGNANLKCLERYSWLSLLVGIEACKLGKGCQQTTCCTLLAFCVVF
jgi:hypothetical protein